MWWFCTLKTPWTESKARSRDAGSDVSALTTSAPSWARARAFFPSGFLVRARTRQWSCSRRRVTAPPCRPVAPTTAMIRASCCAIAVAPSQDKLERQDPNELRYGRLLSPLRRWNAPWGGLADHNTRRLQPTRMASSAADEPSSDLAAHRGDPRRLSKRTVG